MALTFTELEAITNDYFMADGGKAVDIYYKPSFLLDRWLKKKKGIMLRPSGGLKIRVPLNYNDAEAGTFTRNSPLSSDDRTALNAAYFLWKHYYGNATVYLTDELENAGPQAEVDHVIQKVTNAQNSVSTMLAKDLYGAGGDSSEIITGLLSLTSETASLKFGDIAENDLVASDGTKPWEGKTNSDSEALSLAVLRTLRSDAKIYDGPDGKPNILITTEALFNKLNGILQVQQRFEKDQETASAGFQNLVFESAIISPDDFCPSGYMFALNEKFVGFAVHEKGMFTRTSWKDLEGPVGRSMKILWHGNMVCSNRKAHKAHSNLS